MQQRLIKDAEDGGGRSHAEREHGQNGEGKGRRFPELALVAVAASAIPTWRATSMEPMRALRYE
jgi:hypothetical protein